MWNQNFKKEVYDNNFYTYIYNFKYVYVCRNRNFKCKKIYTKTIKNIIWQKYYNVQRFQVVT